MLSCIRTNVNSINNLISTDILVRDRFSLKLLITILVIIMKKKTMIISTLSVI